MAPIAVTQIMPNSPIANAPANAAAAPDIDAVFANLLAGMAPVAQTSATQIPAQISAPAQIPAPQTADLPVNNAQLLPDETQIALPKKIPAKANGAVKDDAKPAPAPLLANLAAPAPGKPLEPAKPKVSANKKENTTPDPAAMPVIFATPNMPAPVKPVQTADVAVGDVMKAATPALPTAPGAAKPVDAKPDPENKSAPKDAPQAKAADPAIIPATAHINAKPAPQTAQTQPAHANPSVKAADANAQGNNGNSQKQDRRDAPQPVQTAQTQSDPTPQSAAQPVHAPAPQAPVQAHASQSALQVPAITAGANVQPAQSAPVHVSASLQVSAQNDAQPNIGDIAVTIAAKSHAGEKHFDIRLDPPELGRIDVHLSVDDSGKAQAHLSADKPQTLELLQRDSTDLQRALKDAGVDLSNNGLNFSLKGEQRQAGQSPPRGNGRARALSVNAIAAQSANPVRSYAPGSVQLDIRV